MTVDASTRQVAEKALRPRTMGASAVARAKHTAASHLDFVSSLRGIAALYVIVYHVWAMPVTRAPLSRVVYPIVTAGGSGVLLFFVVSSFTLSRSWRSRHGHPYPEAAFYVRRAFRIIPLFAVMLVASLVRDILVFHNRPGWRDLLLNLTFLFNLVPGKSTGIVWASWTLSVEMLFYSVFPLLMRLITNFQRSIMLLIGSIAVSWLFRFVMASTSMPASTMREFVHFSIVTCFPAFACGLAAHYWYERSLPADNQVERAAAWVLCGCGAAHLAIASLVGPQSFLSLPLFSLNYSIALLALAARPIGLLVNRATVAAGEISYSLYLLHPMVVYFVSLPEVEMLRRGWSSELALAGGTAAAMAVLTPLAATTYRLIERPGMQFSGRLVASMANRPGRGAVHGD